MRIDPDTYYIHLHPAKHGWLINSPSLRKRTWSIWQMKAWANALDAIDYLRNRMLIPWRKIVWVWGKDLCEQLQDGLKGEPC